MYCCNSPTTGCFWCPVFCVISRTAWKYLVEFVRKWTKRNDRHSFAVENNVLPYTGGSRFGSPFSQTATTQWRFLTCFPPSPLAPPALHSYILGACNKELMQWKENRDTPSQQQGRTTANAHGSSDIKRTREFGTHLVLFSCYFYHRSIPS